MKKLAWGLFIFGCLLSIAIFVSIARSVEAREHPEKWYQDTFCCCEKEVVLPDKTRVDCLTATHAIEYDFADKWAEAMGQALYYGCKTGKKPGVYLILEDPKNEWRYVQRVVDTIMYWHLNMDLWIIADGKVSFVVMEEEKIMDKK